MYGGTTIQMTGQGGTVRGSTEMRTRGVPTFVDRSKLQAKLTLSLVDEGGTCRLRWITREPGLRLFTDQYGRYTGKYLILPPRITFATELARR